MRLARTLCATAGAVAALGMCAASAAAVTVTNANGNCGNLTDNTPGETGDGYGGGCVLGASADNLVMTMVDVRPPEVFNCSVDIDGSNWNNSGTPPDFYAHVSTDGELGINDLRIWQDTGAGNTSNCAATSPCLGDGDIPGSFALSWPGTVDSYDPGTDKAMMTVNVCVDTWIGAHGGNITGAFDNATNTLTFDDAPVGDGSMTWDGTFDLDDVNVGGLQVDP